MEMLSFAVIGVLAGFLADRLGQGTGYGLVVDILAGVAGALVGGLGPGLVAPQDGTWPWGLITALFGGVILLHLIGLRTDGGRRE